jgi:hypothetical protein
LLYGVMDLRKARHSAFTPCESNDIANCSETRVNGDWPSGLSSSVMSRPGADGPIPELTIKGPSEPAQRGAENFNGAPVSLRVFFES